MSLKQIISAFAILMAIAIESNAQCGGADFYQTWNCGYGTANVNVVPFGGVPPYHFLWENGETNSNITVPVGSYKVTITDSDTCFMYVSCVVVEPECCIWASITTSPDDCQSGNSGQIAIWEIGGGQAPYTILFQNGTTKVTDGNTPVFVNNLQSGWYYITVTDATGCSNEQMIEIEQQTGPTVKLTASDLTCTITNTTVSTQVTGGPVSYAWNTGATTSTLSNVGPGTYSVKVTNNDGCTDADTIEITAPQQITLHATAQPTTCGENNGSITLTSGPWPIVVEAPNGAIFNLVGPTATISNLQSGVYTATVTNGSGCTETATAIVASSIEAKDTVICKTSCNPETVYGFYFNQTTDTVVNEFVNGCPRKVTIHFFRLTGSNTNVNISACFGTTIAVNGNEYTNSQLVVVNGSGQCNTTVTFNLVFGPEPTTKVLDPITICGQKDTVFTIQNVVHANGCISEITLQDVVISKMTRDTMWLNDRDTCGPFTFAYIEFHGIQQTGQCKESAVMQLVLVHAYAVDTVVVDTIHDCGYVTGSNLIYIGEQVVSDSCIKHILFNRIITDPIISSLETAWICPGETHFWNVTGGNYGQGFYSDTTTNSNGCPMYKNLAVFQREQVSFQKMLYACPGTTVEFRGQQYGFGSHEVICPAQLNECDTTVYLTVLYYQVVDSTFHLSSCKMRQDSVSTGFTVNGCPYNKRFIFDYMPYRDTVTVDTCASLIWPMDLDTIHGECDTLRLTVFQTYENLVLLYGDTCELSLNGHQVHSITTDIYGCRTHTIFTWRAWPSFNSTSTVMLCYGSSYDFYGQNLNVAGTYSKTFQSVHGCDSTISVVLCFLPEKKSEFNRTICASDSTTWNGIVFHGANGSQDTVLFFQTPDGCDSTSIFHLAVVYADTLSFEEFTCYEDEAGEHQQFYPSQNGGCGTLIINKVTFDPAVAPVISLDSVTCEHQGRAWITRDPSWTSIRWSNGETTDTVTSLSAGTYWVTVSNANGCTDVASVTLSAPNCEPPQPECPLLITYFANDRINCKMGEILGGKEIEYVEVYLSRVSDGRVYQTREYKPNASEFEFDFEIGSLNLQPDVYAFDGRFKFKGDSNWYRLREKNGTQRVAKKIIVQ